jgi:hypothetical protein
MRRYRSAFRTAAFMTARRTSCRCSALRNGRCRLAPAFGAARTRRNSNFASNLLIDPSS